MAGRRGLIRAVLEVEVPMDVLEELEIVIRSQARGLAASDGVSEFVPLLDGGLGFDSVRVVELIFYCENKSGIRFPESVMEFEGMTGGKLAECIRNSLAHRAD